MGGRNGPAPPKVDTAKSFIAVKITYQAYWTAVVRQSLASAGNTGIPGRKQMSECETPRRNPRHKGGRKRRPAAEIGKSAPFPPVTLYSGIGLYGDRL